MVRISALAQRAEYIWADGLEGDDSKVSIGSKIEWVSAPEHDRLVPSCMQATDMFACAAHHM